MKTLQQIIMFDSDIVQENFQIKKNIARVKLMCGDYLEKTKKHSVRNKTLTCTESEMKLLSVKMLYLIDSINVNSLINRIINQDLEMALPFMPKNFIDLLVLDPPYNLTKNYGGYVFRACDANDYIIWFEQMLNNILPMLRTNASVYVCSDWKTSNLIFPVLDKYLHVRNRITWEREKGRGAKKNWKNNTEDIWFATVGEDYCFNVEDVKLKKHVIAPYRSENGEPKDWQESKGKKYRFTYPSNLWSDITIPFWSMPENTNHPTQKPEKLIAKLILASSKPGDFIFDPFLGSGTTAVVANKLNRKFVGIEKNKEYCCLAIKRLTKAKTDKRIQGYADGVFLERNTLC